MPDTTGYEIQYKQDFQIKEECKSLKNKTKFNASAYLRWSFRFLRSPNTTFKIDFISFYVYVSAYICVYTLYVCLVLCRPEEDPCSSAWCFE